MLRVSTKLVLVVEDDPALRRDLCTLIELAGFPAIGARDGVDAVSYLNAGAPVPALIVLDLGMSRMNGWEFRSWLKLHPELMGVPVLLASGHPGLEALAGELGVAGWLRKPFAPEDFLQRLRAICA